MTAIKRDDEAPHIDGHEALAGLIFNMRYADLRDVGRALHEMTQSDEGKDLWDLSQEHQWAEILFNWAEANLPEPA